MSRYIPLPELAAAIRNAPVLDAMRTFKIIATVVIHAYRMKEAVGEEFTDPRNLKHVRKKVKELQQGLQMELVDNNFSGTHLLTPFQLKVTLELIYLNVEKIEGHPDVYLFTHAREIVTAAEHWLVNCAIQPECDRNGSLRRLWSGYLEEQPTYQPLGDAVARFESQVRQFEEEGLSTNCPGLTQIILRLHSVECFRSIKEWYLLKYYLRLGATAAYVWTHMWQTHEVQRDQPLPVTDIHVQYALRGIRTIFTNHIHNWRSEIPRQVRQELALHNFGGDFLFLLNHVFPNIIAPLGSTIREDMFGWEIHQYIMRCATSTEFDPRGWMAWDLNRANLNPEPENGSRAFYQPHASFVAFEDDYGPMEQRDVVLEAYGPFINVTAVAELGYPSDGEICTICQYGFDTIGNWKGETCCCQLNLCKHMFHKDCLHDWLNGVHVGDVKCCNCRAIICNARPRRAKEA